MTNKKEIYYCYSELTIIKIIVYAYDKFGVDELKRFNKYGQLKENNISKAIREFLPILGHKVILKLLLQLLMIYNNIVLKKK